MGAEAACRAEYNGRRSKGTALLETDHLLFRGDYRVKVLFQEIVSLDADDKRLIVLTEQGELSLELGPAAKRWKTKIENPPTLLNKLGVKPGMRVAAVNMADAGVLQQLGPLATSGKVDLLFLGGENTSDLKALAKAPGRITEDGAVWMVYPKGQKHIREADVISAGRAAGLKDTKVVRFSPTHTALKFVIPVARRAKA